MDAVVSLFKTEVSNNMKTLIFDAFHVFRYTWFTMEALEDTWENLQKIIEVCIFTSEICLFLFK